MRNLRVALACAVACSILASYATTTAQAPKSKRINRVVELLEKEGVRFGSANQATAEAGRTFTNRQMPW